MKHKLLYLFGFLCFLITACAPLPPTMADIEAKKFQPLSDKAVIYIVRPVVDISMAGPLSLSGVGPMSTFQGTYYRWEVEPGKRRIETAGASVSSVTINAQPGQMYFVQHTVVGSRRGGIASAWVQRIDADTGRRMVSQAQHL